VPFWDSSALVPLLITEAESAAVSQMLLDDNRVTVWWGTRVECISALLRRSRETGDSVAEQTGRRALHLLSAAWAEIEPSIPLRLEAERLLAVHRLRAADALQLAAALVWADGSPSGRRVVCLDARLAQAARLEGFTVLPT
jgi:predicted nucleic acid-binding protein